jgi:hypothetical protein
MATSENTWCLCWNGKSAVRFPTRADAEEFKKRHSAAMQTRLTIKQEKRRG